jgi:hypothetical protein
MIKVPEPVLAQLAAAFGTSKDKLTYLGGGRLESDGITYTYERGGEKYVLKILALSLDSPDALHRLEARLEFVHFLGERGAPIVNPLNLPGVGLYAAHPAEGHRFIAYRRILMFIVLQDGLKNKPSQYRLLKAMILEEPPILGKWTQ